MVETALSARDLSVGPLDDSGNKNSIQQAGSTATYLQRYTLLPMLGLSAADRDEDDDGSKSGCITFEQEQEIRALLAESKTPEERFLKTWGIDTIGGLHEKSYVPAVAMLKQKAASRGGAR